MLEVLQHDPSAVSKCYGKKRCSHQLNGLVVGMELLSGMYGLLSVEWHAGLSRVSGYICWDGESSRSFEETSAINAVVNFKVDEAIPTD